MLENLDLIDSNVNCLELIKKAKKDKTKIKNEETNTIMNMYNMDKPDMDFISVYDKTKDSDSNMKTPKNFGKKFIKSMNMINNEDERNLNDTVSHSMTSMKPTKIVLNIGKYVHKILIFSLGVCHTILDYILIYGTELLVQMLALCVIAFVVVLKSIESMIKSRHLGLCINYMENINFSRLRKFRISIDFKSLFAGIKRVLWISWKLTEFFLIVLKHILIQLFFGIFFIISLIFYSIFQLITSWCILPTVDKTMNILKLDPTAISELTKYQFKRLSVGVSIWSYDIAPLVSDWLNIIGNIKFNISNVSLLRTVTREIIGQIREVITTINTIITDVMDVIKTLTNIGSSILMLVTMLLTYIKMLCDTIYYICYTLKLVGYFVHMFYDTVMSGTKALSRLQRY